MPAATSVAISVQAATSQTNTPRAAAVVGWIAALSCAVSLVLQGQLTFGVGGIGLPLYRIILTGLLILTIDQRSKPLERNGKLARMAVYVWSGVSTITYLAHFQEPGAMGAYLNYGVDPLLLMLLTQSGAGRRFLRRLLYSLCVLTVIGSAIAIWEFVGGSYVLPDDLVAFRTRERYGEVRGQAFFAHPLVLGVSAAIFLVLLAGSGFIAVRHRVLYCGCLFGGALASLSRGAIAILAAASLVYVVARFRLGRRASMPILAAVAAIMLVIAIQDSGVDETTDEATISTAYRAVVTETAVDTVRSRPFGAGFRDLSELPLTAELGGKSLQLGRTIDNDFAIAAIYGGLPLVAGYIAIFVASAAVVTKVPSGSLLVKRPLGLASLTALAVASTFVATLSFSVLSALFWVVVARLTDVRL